jgi:RND family efflux transporter MFP subunit
VYHGFTRVTAPISGVVTEKKIESGSMAVPGVPVITVEDTSGMRVEVFADETLSGRLKAGMAADIILDAAGQEGKGVITEVVPSVDPLSRTFLVKISVTGMGLKSGVSAKVRIPVGRKEALLVPKTSVVERGQLTGVFAVDDRGVISYRLVRTGKGYGGDVEILSGLNPKDRVITAGTEKAVDGGILEEAKTK